MKYSIAEMECPVVTCKAPPLALLISVGILRVPPSLSFSYIRESALNRSIIGVYVDMYSAMYEAFAQGLKKAHGEYERWGLFIGNIMCLIFTSLQMAKTGGKQQKSVRKCHFQYKL